MMSTLPSDVVLLDSQAGVYALYAWQNIMFACWSQAATLPAMQRVAHHREAIDKRCPEGVSVVYLIADGAGLPTPEARAAAIEMLERYGHQRACLAMVVFGEGFWVSAMRATATDVPATMRGATQGPMKFFSSVEELVRWLPERHHEHTGVRIATEQFRTVVRELAERL